MINDTSSDTKWKYCGWTSTSAGCLGGSWIKAEGNTSTVRLHPLWAMFPPTWHHSEGRLLDKMRGAFKLKSLTGFTDVVGWEKGVCTIFFFNWYILPCSVTWIFRRVRRVWASSPARKRRITDEKNKNKTCIGFYSSCLNGLHSNAPLWINTFDQMQSKRNNNQ